MLFTLKFSLDIIYKIQVISIYNVSLDNLFSSSHKSVRYVKIKSKVSKR